MSKPVRWTQEMIDEYVRKGYWDETTLSDLWERTAREMPDKEALVDTNFRLTWADAERWIDRLALGLLDLGLKRDDLIVVQLPTGVEHTLLRVACEKAGIVCLPALRNLRDAEMEYIMGHAEAVGVVIPWKFRDFDYFRMIQGLRPNLPKLRHIFMVGDEVPEGVLSIMEMVKRPIETEYPANYLKGKGLRSTETSLI
ncbi:MAG: AMP-binding protein, partial [Proteobacteria bacterium]|nr:AMP-binding protein [Pseudomonadota bacterium]